MIYTALATTIFIPVPIFKLLPVLLLTYMTHFINKTCIALLSYFSSVKLYFRSGEVSCLPNYYLLGVRKCGTSDLLKWFSYPTERNVKVLVKVTTINTTITKWYNQPFSVFSQWCNGKLKSA